MLEKLRYIKREFQRSIQIWNLYHADEFETNRKAGNLIRYTHSIEKGLSIEKPKQGFGHQKQMVMMQLISELESSDDPFHQEAVEMAEATLKTYVDVHAAQGYHDETIDKIACFLEKRGYSSCKKEYGGVLHINKRDMDFNVEEIEKMFLSRHSIRNFDDREVDRDTLLKAIDLAKRVPSACNRQGVRIYVIHHTRASEFQKWLSGVGGFENSIKEYILITAKHSMYTVDENCQYIVSASMYAAYLSLTLHTYGMGACVVQRMVTPSPAWSRIRELYNIPADEQAICVLGVGMLKDEYLVPVSHRLSDDILVKFR